MHRISIKSMLWYVSFIAVGLAALRNANDEWADLVVLITLCMIGSGILSMINCRGKERAWWTGYCLFATGYIILAFAPGFTSEIEPHLGTTRVLRYFRSLVRTPTMSRNYRKDPDVYLDLLGRREDLKTTTGYNPDELHTLESDLEIFADYLIEQGSDVTKGMQLSPQGQARARMKSLFPGATNQSAFYLVGHCLFALLAGLVGALISSRIYRKQTASPER